MDNSFRNSQKFVIYSNFIVRMLYKQVYWHSLSFVVRFVVMLYSSCLSLYMMRSVIVNIDKRILLNEVCRITICWLNIIGLCNSTPHMRHFMATNFHKFDYHMVIYSAATLDFTTEHCERPGWRPWHWPVDLEMTSCPQYGELEHQVCAVHSGLWTGDQQVAGYRLQAAHCQVATLGKSF